MTIQWFPGHMAKARREVTEKLKLVDIIFELIDARLPLSSRNPMIDEVINQKPRLLILNKADMADEQETRKWVEYFAQRGHKAVAINSLEGKGLQQVTKAAQEILKEKFDRMKARGMKPRAIRAMIVGIPNVGKSTLINRLAKKNIAKTGNTPGVTKAQQWIKVGKELELLDTPGILWPKFEDQEVGFKLALTGAIKDTITNMEDLAVYGLRFLSDHYPKRMEERYGFEFIHEELVDTFDHIGKLRRVFGPGGEIDYDQVAQLIVRDIRGLQLGKLTFDFVDEQLKKEAEQL
ncbi:MAG TPA: ribosome biogenesis GTPase YlqF [Lysinibacillus sp.]|jgi:ribosome biogenesis GTPase A|uniref:ribosome biogenesis GTPase YlqF n=1 Tax=Lysinibacillus TaxID=400634 RepID=UPI00056ACC53|nr:MULTISPECIES: ribosome biogenesis GTPase YlqF [Lysinibacillus]MEE3806996.1 ribosome biogenesis GTPase YlqF [Lysinibacillus fusiformis]HBT71937.1 ribosome biogenesis GTPase YlqF [Lysinibacillus sp.]WCH48749.1 ribosome biogenesis GTPase YlqF [Lysinibacillus sp. OF-1]SCX83095.1 ribosome biogenesis GTPase A [Lysinibacillus sp. SG9]SDB04409.1 ribosome biogenesis GTPase A [Lysinibacillus sp. TC-37]